MPYGLPAELDTPANNAKIEICVTRLMDEGKDKVSAIRICKSSIMQAARDKMMAEDESSGGPEEAPDMERF